jgi:hypothetical protein
MRTRKTQNIKINMTCGLDFRLKKLYLFLHIFLTFSRENSRLGTSPPMMKSVWSHLKTIYKFKLMLVFWPRVFIAGKDLVLTGNRGFKLPAARSVPYILVQWSRHTHGYH